MWLMKDVKPMNNWKSLLLFFVPGVPFGKLVVNETSVVEQNYCGTLPVLSGSVW